MIKLSTERTFISSFYGHSRTIQVRVGVGFGGQIRFPKDHGYHLLSGVYSLTIKGGMLLKPIKAEVQHCVAQDISMLTFLSANLTNYSSLPYKLVAQEECTSFSCMSPNGTIDLQGSLLEEKDQSVIFAVCANSYTLRRVLCRYSVRIFYQSECPSGRAWTAHITVLKDLEICTKVSFFTENVKYLCTCRLTVSHENFCQKKCFSCL